MSESARALGGDSAEGASGDDGLFLLDEGLDFSVGTSEQSLEVLSLPSLASAPRSPAKEALSLGRVIWMVTLAGLICGMATSRLSDVARSQSLASRRAALRTSPAVSLDDAEFRRQLKGLKKTTCHETRISSLQRILAVLREDLRSKKMRCEGLEEELVSRRKTPRRLRSELREIRRTEKRERARIRPIAAEARDLEEKVNRTKGALLALRSESKEALENFLKEQRAELQQVWKMSHGAGEDAPTYEEATLALFYDLLADTHNSDGSLRERWRSYCAAELAWLFLKVRLASADLKKLQKTFLEGEPLDEAQAASLTRSFDGLLDSLQAASEEKAESRALALKAASSVDLAVSKNLNERQRNFDRLNAEAVRGLPPATELPGVFETHAEVRGLAKIREELRLVLEVLRGEEAHAADVGEAALAVFDLLVENSPPFGPARFTVERFKRIDAAAGEEGIVVEFWVTRLLGGSTQSVVAQVVPVNANLRATIGALALKMHLPVVKKNVLEVAGAAFASRERMQGEVEALLRVANKGESLERAGRSTGLAGPSHVGRLRQVDFPEALSLAKGRVCLPLLDVTFSPVVEAVFASRREEPPLLSMPARVYLAQRLLVALGRLHLRGFCHNDVKATNVAVPRESSTPLLLDLQSVARVGELRTTWSPSTLAPEEAVKLAETGRIWTSLRAEAWAVGVLLFSVLSGGELPFASQRSAFLGLASERPAVVARAVEALKKAESPVFALRRLEVPEPWLQICALLLQPEPKLRPTVLQVLNAFPQVLDVLQVVKDADDVEDAAAASH